MDSMYGGHPGVDFVLRGSFPSVSDMVTAFKQASNYTDIWYGEYCIIDTPNKNDEDNGKVYRRGLEYQNDLGGAIYIGQIVGPSSGTPYFQLMSIDDVVEKSIRKLDEYEYRRYPYDYDEETESYITTSGPEAIQTYEFSKDYDESLVPGKWVDDDGTEQFHDSIRYTWCNIRADNADADSWFYVGFEIPYTVIDYAIHQTSPYDEEGDVLTDATEIERIDTEEHPFYEKWDLGLPKGIKGDTLRNLRVITPTAGNRTNIYSASAITVDPSTGESVVGNPGYTGIDDDIAAGRKILVFDYYIYDKLLNPTPIMIYVGDFNLIDKITLDDEGTLTVDLSHDDNTVFEKKIRWVNGVALTEGNGTAGGHITFTFNNDNPAKTQEYDISWIKGIEIEEDGSLIYSYAGTPETANMPENAVPVQANGITSDPTRTAGFYRVEDFLQWIHDVELDSENGHFYVTNNRDEILYQTDLDWIKDIGFADDGTVTLYHTYPEDSTTVYNNLIKWITSVSLSQTTGVFTINWNHGDPTVFHLDWISDVYINEDNGNIYIHHSNPEFNTDTDEDTRFSGELLDARLKLIVSANVSSTGVITLTCNTGETITLNKTGGTQEGQEFQIKIIENVSLNTGIRDDKHIHVKYNTEQSATPIGDPINYIEDMVVRSEDFHLLVLYTDPESRYPGNGVSIDNTGKDQYGHIWVNNTAGSDGSSYRAPDIYWRDMGTIKDQSGILIGFNVDSQTVEDAGYDSAIAGNGPDDTGVCGYLKATYPNGLVGDENDPYRHGTAHKIITYTPPATEDNPDKQDKEFYAYDYNTGYWYYLGKIADSGIRDAKLVANTAQNVEILEGLSTKGLAFKYYEVNPASTAIPSYWTYNYTWV